MKKLSLVFDLDNTLYEADLGFFKLIDKRINGYMKEKLNIEEGLIESKRLNYFKKYGTTLKGLQLFYPIEPDDYLDYVHDVNVELYLKPEKELKEMLESFPYQKVVFSNGNFEYIQRVLSALGIGQCFDYIIDIKMLEYIPKPYAESFGILLKLLHAEAYECLIVDDMRRNIKMASELGFRTVWLDHPVVTDTAILMADYGSIENGRKKAIRADNDEFMPDYAISSIFELPEIVKNFLFDNWQD